MRQVLHDTKLENLYYVPFDVDTDRSVVLTAHRLQMREEWSRKSVTIY